VERLLLVLGIVAPLFGLILLGWIAGRRTWLPGGATQALNAFVVRLALPALLFQIMAEARWSTLWHPGFIAAFIAGVVITFIASLPFSRHRTLAERSLEGLTAAYSNTGFIGIPLCLAAFGPEGGPPPVIASILTVSLLFAFAILLVELDVHRGRRIPEILAGVASALMRNPLVIAPVLGALWMTSGLALPGPIHALTTLLAAASTPCALVTIGLFLAERNAAVATTRVGPSILLKLIVQPAVTAVFALWVFRMPPVWSGAAILIAALPTGTGPFMLAELYGRDTAIAARAILLSTILSVASLTLLLAFFVALQ
jgi:predicted permease